MLCIISEVYCNSNVACWDRWMVNLLFRIHGFSLCLKANLPIILAVVPLFLACWGLFGCGAYKKSATLWGFALVRGEGQPEVHVKMSANLKRKKDPKTQCWVSYLKLNYNSLLNKYQRKKKRSTPFKSDFAHSSSTHSSLQGSWYDFYSKLSILGVHIRVIHPTVCGCTCVMF